MSRDVRSGQMKPRLRRRLSPLSAAPPSTACLRRATDSSHALLELVGVPGDAAEEHRRERLADRREPARHRPPVHDLGAGPPRAVSSQIQRAPLDFVSQATIRPGSTADTTLRVGQSTALRLFTPTYHCPARSPPLLSGIIRTTG